MKGSRDAGMPKDQNLPACFFAMRTYGTAFPR